MRKLLCMILVLLIIAGCMTFSVSGDSLIIEGLSKNKISEKLSVVLNSLEDNEKLEVAVWLNDESEKVYQKAYHENISKAIANEEVSVSLSKAQAIIDNSMNADVEDVTIDDVQSVLSVKRLTSSAIISDRNISWTETFNDAIGNRVEVVYISQFAPIVVLRLSKGEILALEKQKDVDSVYLWTDDVSVAHDSVMDVSQTTDTEDYGVWQNITDIYTMRHVNGYTGRNINVGLVEGALPDYHETLLGDNIIRCSGDTTSIYFVPHATRMAEIISGVSDTYIGVAPDANLYCIGYESDVMSTIDMLMTNPINVINLSVTFESFDESLTNLYDVYSQYLDYLIYRYNVTVCTAAGNHSSGGVMDGQMSYNSIVVGDIDDKNTLTLDDDVKYTTSSYSTGVNIAYKPDLCAPGHNVRTPLVGNSSGGGTSAASAVVSGSCALLMEANPVLISKPMLMKSVLMSSVNRIANLSNIYSTSSGATPALLRAYGAGMIDVVNANNLIRNTNNWKYLDYPELMAGNADYTMDISVSQNAVSRSKKLAVCLTWDAYARENTSSAFPGCFESAVHRLELYDPSGVCVAKSRISYDKKQYIYYQPIVAGVYEARVVKDDDDGAGLAVVALSYSLL